MQTDEFLRQVQERARLNTGDEALRIVHATLATLGERLPRDERRDLAAQLPDQLKSYVLEYQDTARFPLEEFYNRVAARSDLGAPAAIEQAGIVTAVLQDAITGGQLEEIRAQLDEEYDELF
jgi:uncharacterized protein (DUF2267 family)